MIVAWLLMASNSSANQYSKMLPLVTVTRHKECCKVHCGQKGLQPAKYTGFDETYPPHLDVRRTV